MPLQTMPVSGLERCSRGLASTPWTVILLLAPAGGLKLLVKKQSSWGCEPEVYPGLCWNGLASLTVLQICVWARRWQHLYPHVFWNPWWETFESFGMLMLPYTNKIKNETKTKDSFATVISRIEKQRATKEVRSLFFPVIIVIAKSHAFPLCSRSH